MNETEHKAYHRRLIYIAILLVIILFGSATFYHYIEKWRYLDAVYFSATTVTTIGYGDITPHTDAGKIFTIIFAFTGVGIVLYGLSLIASHFVEVREEFWMEKLGKIKMRHPKTFLEKIRNVLGYKSEKLVNEYEKSVRKK